MRHAKLLIEISINSRAPVEKDYQTEDTDYIDRDDPSPEMYRRNNSVKFSILNGIAFK